MAKERNKTVPAVYAIFEKEGKILMGRRRNSGYYDGWYGVPAGHVESGEIPTLALIREAKEEVGVDIKPEDVKLIHALYRTAHDETGDRSDYFFVVKSWSGEPRICEPDKCDDLGWFPMGSLPENMIHHERGVIEKWGKGITYSEVDKDHTVHNPNAN